MFDGFPKHYYEAWELRSQKVNICSDFVLAAAKPQVDQHPELNPRLQPYDVDKLAAILERLTSHQRDLILAMAEHDRMPVESALRQVAELENVIAAVSLGNRRSAAVPPKVDVVFSHRAGVHSRSSSDRRARNDARHVLLDGGLRT